MVDFEKFCDDENITLILKKLFPMMNYIYDSNHYNFHFKNIMDNFAVFYLRRILKIIKLLENNLYKLFTKVPGNERRVSTEVLFISLFALSSLLTTEREFARLEKKYVVKILFNTYLAGVSCLEKK